MSDFEWKDFQAAVEQREANAMPIKEKVPYLVVITGAEKKVNPVKKSEGVSLKFKINLVPESVKEGWNDGDRAFASSDYVFFGYRDEDGGLDSLTAYNAQALVPALGFAGKNWNVVDMIGHTFIAGFALEERQDGGGIWPKLKWIRPFRKGEELSPVVESIASAAKVAVDAAGLSDADTPF